MLLNAIIISCAFALPTTALPSNHPIPPRVQPMQSSPAPCMPFFPGEFNEPSNPNLGFPCLEDLPVALADRFLSGAVLVNATGMTVEMCLNFCTANGFIFAGVEFGDECYCDNFLGLRFEESEPSDECRMPCAGDPAEVCGGPGLLNLFWNGCPPPIQVPAVGPWESIGCAWDFNSNRTLERRVSVDGNVTVEACVAECFNEGFQLAGLEFGKECWCGMQIDPTLVSSSTLPECAMICQGNFSEICGGPDALSVYNFTGTNLPPRQN